MKFGHVKSFMQVRDDEGYKNEKYEENSAGNFQLFTTFFLNNNSP